MGIKLTGLELKGLLAAAAAIAATAVTATAAKAQNAIIIDEPDVLEVIDEVTFNHTGNYYRNRTFNRQIDYMFGPGWFGAAAFPDLEMDRDAEALEEAYKELMFLQTHSTATIRVPDLPNPYETSVQLLPLSQVGGRVVGSELNFEPLPRR
ncbi:MAG: hypothetical protein F6J97_02040 [Leptolyngbya sp. SIO4C1]|nr:hypothetical protein [Leptolyngbya sp. SIO4C1]